MLTARLLSLWSRRTLWVSEWRAACGAFAAVRTASSGSTRERATRTTSWPSSRSRDGSPSSRFPHGLALRPSCECPSSCFLLHWLSRRWRASFLAQRFQGRSKRPWWRLWLFAASSLRLNRQRWIANRSFLSLLRRMNSMSALFKLSMFIRVSRMFHFFFFFFTNAPCLLVLPSLISVCFAALPQLHDGPAGHPSLGLLRHLRLGHAVLRPGAGTGGSLWSQASTLTSL